MLQAVPARLAWAQKLVVVWAGGYRQQKGSVGPLAGVRRQLIRVVESGFGRQSG